MYFFENTMKPMKPRRKRFREPDSEPTTPMPQRFKSGNDETPSSHHSVGLVTSNGFPSHTHCTYYEFMDTRVYWERREKDDEIMAFQQKLDKEPGKVKLKEVEIDALESKLEVLKLTKEHLRKQIYEDGGLYLSFISLARTVVQKEEELSNMVQCSQWSEDMREDRWRTIIRAHGIKDEVANWPRRKGLLNSHQVPKHLAPRSSSSKRRPRKMSRSTRSRRSRRSIERQHKAQENRAQGRDTQEKQAGQQDAREQDTAERNTQEKDAQDKEAQEQPSCKENDVQRGVLEETHFLRTDAFLLTLLFVGSAWFGRRFYAR